jgi:hypothetical protein
MKFNMGCGLRKPAGYVNVDAFAEAEPDEVWDLEQTPWPWSDNCAEEIHFIHSLEHMGANPKVFLAIMKETYRIAAPGCVVQIHVPHPRHDHYTGDPTHVRPITPEVLKLFDRELNERWRESGNSNTPLALYTGVDFKITQQRTMLCEPYASQLAAGEISREQVDALVKHQFNIAYEYRFQLTVRKG